MAKGRKLTTSRSELLLGSYTIQTNVQNEEFNEDDVWNMVDGNKANHGHDHEWNSRASRRVPLSDGGLSSAFEGVSGKVVSSPRIVHQFQNGDSFASPRGRHVATSAPVNVPDWSKIYRVDSVESMHDSDDVIDNVIDDHDLNMIPPHEYLARSRNSAAHSVFVGAGRTLKGRDLSRVRDAVWSQTGFNG